MTLFLANLDPAHVTIREIEKLGRHAVDSNGSSTTTSRSMPATSSAKWAVAFTTCSMV